MAFFLDASLLRKTMYQYHNSAIICNNPLLQFYSICFQNMLYRLILIVPPEVDFKELM